jgi:hypothetical protein
VTHIRAIPVLVLVLLLAGCMGLAQKLPWQTGDASDDQHQSVHFLYPEQVNVPAGRDNIIELHFKVNPGMHINSHTPREKSLIPTQLAAIEPPGLKIGPVDFPPGSDYSFAAMPNDKLSVYSGEFVLRAHVHAEPGDHLLEGVLRYQACDNNTCYPPRKAPVAVDIIAR